MNARQFRECVRMELHAIRLSLEGLDSTIRVCVFALQGRDDDEISEDVYTVLQPISAKIQEARVHVSNIVSLLQREAETNAIERGHDQA
jgi:hypothetical protein